MGYHYTTSSFTVSTVGVTRKQRSYCIISSETPEYRIAMLVLGFSFGRFIFRILETTVAGDLEAG
jgi:hypothetical protein